MALLGGTLVRPERTLERVRKPLTLNETMKLAFQFKFQIDKVF